MRSLSSLVRQRDPAPSRPAPRAIRRRMPVLLLAAALPAATVGVASPAVAAPVSAAATLSPATPTGTNSYYRGPVTLNLSATDATDGVQRLEYRLGDTGPYQPVTSSQTPYPASLSGSVPITQQGVSVVSYRAVGGDGSVEDARTVTVRIDTAAPVVSWPGIVNGHVGDAATLIPTRTDPAPASGGVFIQQMYIDGSAVTPLPVATDSLSLGRHTFGVVASDAAGNAARYNQTFIVTTSFTDLGTLLDQYSGDGGVTADTAAKLHSLLADAKTAADAGRTKQATTALQQFVSAAQADVRPGRVRDRLVADARYLQRQVAGTLPADPPTGTTVQPAAGPNPIPVPQPAGSTHYPNAKFRVLVFSKTEGYRHDHIPDTAALIQKWGKEYGFDVDIWDPALSGSLPSTPFTSAAALAKYKTIIFSSPVDGTTPTSPTSADALNPDELAAFKGYVEAGGGYVGLHGAADVMHNVPWYGNLVGAYFVNHPTGQAGEGTCSTCLNVQVNTEDSSNPATAALPKTWLTTDELYNFDHDPRGDVHTLLSLNEASYQRSLNNTDAATTPLTLMGGDHPISWCQRYDGGRSFSLILGHDRAQYYRPSFTNILLEGIKWTAGLTQANCSTFRETRTLLTTDAAAGTLNAGLADTAGKLLESAEASYLAKNYTAAKNSLNRVVAIAGEPTSGDSAARGELQQQARQLGEWMQNLQKA